MTSSVPNFPVHEILILTRSQSYLPSFKFQLQQEVPFLKRAHDVIMTSLVPNLVHEILILTRSQSYLPSFKFQIQQEVPFLKSAYDVIMTSSVPNLIHENFNPHKVTIT